MILHFGDHKGEDIQDVPIDYLKWLSEKCWFDDVREAAEKEYIRRIDHHEEY